MCNCRKQKVVKGSPTKQKSPAPAKPAAPAPSPPRNPLLRGIAKKR